MMRLNMQTTVVFVLAAAWLSAVSAAPAIVWRSTGSDSSVVHRSHDVSAKRVLKSVLPSEENDSSIVAVFVVGRNGDGSEGLSTLAANGSLPQLHSQYETAHCIHHSVTGVESPHSMVRHATAFTSQDDVLQVSLDEFLTKRSMLHESEPVEMQVSENGSTTLMNKSTKLKTKRARELSQANVLIVSIDMGKDTPEQVDAAVSSAIQDEKVSNVVLTSVRSMDEVKQERLLQSHRKLSLMTKVSRNSRLLNSNARRRLEDEQQEEEEQENEQNNQNNNQGYDEDMSGVYYVHATPNIFAAILFFIMFAVVTWIGISCMGNIRGQDVYVTKMPPVGREA